jgi:hypothetical protein
VKKTYEFIVTGIKDGGEDEKDVLFDVVYEDGATEVIDGDQLKSLIGQNGWNEINCEKKSVVKKPGYK